MPTTGGGTRRIPPSGIMPGVRPAVLAVGVHQCRPTSRWSARRPQHPRTEDHLGSLNAEGINASIQRGIRRGGAHRPTRTGATSTCAGCSPLRRALRVDGLVDLRSNDKRTCDREQPDNHSFRSFTRWGCSSRKAEEAPRKCDDETNSPDVVDRGQLICQIGVAPVVPAEFIMIEVVQNMGSGG
jgi:hypothetical protein